MTRIDKRDQWVGQQRLEAQGCVVLRSGADAQFRAALLDMLDQGQGLCFVQLDLCQGHVLTQFCNCAGQQAACHGGNGRQPERSPPALPQIDRTPPDLFQIGENAACHRQELATRFRQRHMARRPLENGDAEIGTQRHSAQLTDRYFILKNK
jgi:hypothetical protein